MAARACGVDAYAFCQITHIHDYAHGRNQTHAEIALADVPDVIVQALGAAAGLHRSHIDQRFDPSYPGRSQRIADEGRLMQ